MRISVAYDHAVVRSGLETILGAREGWEVCAEAETRDEAAALTRGYRPDVAILDLNMPGITGLEAAEIKNRDLVAAVEAVWRGEPYVSRHVDAVIPARTTPLFMLLAESDLLTAQEHERVRLVARQMGHLMGALRPQFLKFSPRLRKVSIESSIRTPQFPVS
jgi:CheY-like chemotaxis protein